MDKRRVSAYTGAIIAMTVWGCTFIFTQEALKSFSPVAVVSMRICLAVVLLFLFAIATRSLQKPDKKDILRFIAAGFAQPFLYFVCEAYGLTMVSATMASVIMSMLPLVAPFLAWLFLKEKVTWFNIAGIIISFIGVLLIVFQGGELSVKLLGVVMLSLAILAAITYSMFLRKVPEKYSNVSIVFYVHLSSLLFFLPMFFITEHNKINFADASLSSYMAIALLALLGSFVCFVLFCRSVRVIGVTKANAFCNLMPAVTALAVWIIYGEAPNLWKLVGIVLVILGLFVCQKEKKINDI